MDRWAFLEEFFGRFKRYVEGHAENEQLYVELTERAVRMQRDVGHHGVMAFKPPFANYVIHDYHLVLNLLPQYRDFARDMILSRSQAPQYASTIRDVLVRYSGDLKEQEALARRELRNPLAWLREGVKWVLASPVSILANLGVLTPSVQARVTGSRLLRVGAGLVAFVTLVAAVVQIITGWEATAGAVRKWLGP